MKKIRLIAVGDELLDGRVRDHNAWWFGARAPSLGARLTGVTVVADEVDAIVDAVRRAAPTADAVIVTGGLGPTPDDRTRTALARAAGVPLARSDRAIERLRERYAGRGRDLDPGSLRQADAPVGARVIDNPHGTADGFVVDVDGTDVLALPGVPSEFEAMVLSAFASAAPRTPDAATRLALVGLFESEAAERVRAAVGDEAERVTWRAALPIVEVGLGALSEAGAARAREALAPWALPDGVDHPAAALGQLATRHGVRIATAESCTGGRVASWITDVPGASAWFDAGYVTYANRAKTETLGVEAALIAAHGAVSRPVAVAMARGARARAHADVAVALTGIAGPGGGSDARPVGTVWLACAHANGVDMARAWFARRDRSTFKSLAATLALRMAAAAIDPTIDPSLFRGVQEYHREGRP